MSDKKLIKVCICGLNTKKADVGWLKAGALVGLLICCGAAWLVIAERDYAVLPKLFIGIGAFELVSFLFYLLKGHSPKCALRQAGLLLLRLLSASQTHAT